MTFTDRLLSAFRPQRALTPQQIFGADVWEAIQGTSGERVDQKTAMTLSAVWSIVRLLSQDIATLPWHAVDADGEDRIPVDPQPSWIDTPAPSDPNFTKIDYLTQVCVSLLLDGNSFTLALPSVIDPVDLTVLNPQRVEIKKRAGRVTYTVRDDNNGIVSSDLTADQILHIPWVRRPGELRGMSPVQVQEETIGRGLAAQEISSRFFKQGHVFGGVIEVPRDTDMTPDQVKAMLKDLNERHGGHRKAWIPGALTGGATFKETFMKPADSQLLETEKWIKEQVGDAYGVPAFMQNSNEPGAVAYASSEAAAGRYKQSALLPIAIRIDTAHKRLLGRPGREMKFNFDGVLRADSEKRWKAYREAWQIGAMNQDEIRAKEDLPPLPNGIGQVFWVPLNFGPAETVKDQPLRDPPGPRPAPQGDANASQE